jgi:5-methylcytosine-specific restriction endonuclease McrA
MARLPPVFRPVRPSQPSHEPSRQHDAKRRGAKPWRRWYKLAIWLELRAVQLAANPLCRRCQARGHTVAATVANHVKPHKGVWVMFADAGNLESLCKGCHDAAIQYEEAHGFSGDVDVMGKYLDPRHPSNHGGGGSNP